jgi:hypothetical protein
LCTRVVLGWFVNLFSVQVPVGIQRDRWPVQPTLFQSINGAQETH